ncbi:MAG: DUF1849 family protein [Alphaproteobacteria bacterium]|nr:DUF1849 family protein [Alphaproteobacteria bacterium]
MAIGRRFVTAATIGFAVLTVAGAEAAHGATMTPHRATYVLSAAPGVGQKEATVIDGLMVFELSDDCDGHTLTDRTVIRLSAVEGYSVTLDSQYSAWESKDGVSFRFLTSFRLDGDEIETIRGSARLDKPGGSGIVSYVSPEAKELELPQGTRFPIEAGIHTIGKIETGARQLSYILFDGSGTDGANFATDFVVDEPMEAGTPPTGSVTLLDGPSWRIRTAVFDLDDESAPPLTEFDGQTHANGVISGFILESDAFAALATLTKLEALPDSGC